MISWITYFLQLQTQRNPEIHCRISPGDFGFGFPLDRTTAHERGQWLLGGILRCRYICKLTYLPDIGFLPHVLADVRLRSLVLGSSRSGVRIQAWWV
jgi:hypothetical protein